MEINNSPSLYTLYLKFKRFLLGQNYDMTLFGITLILQVYNPLTLRIFRIGI